MLPIRSIVLCLFMLCATWLQAADQAGIVVTPASPEVGDTVTVTITTDTAATLTSGQLRLTFDDARLDFAAAVKDTAAASLTVSGDPNADGSLEALLDYGSGAVSSGTLATVTFTATAAGPADVELIDFGTGQPFGTTLFDDGFAVVDVTVPASPTTVTISAPAPVTERRISVTVTQGGVTMPVSVTIGAATEAVEAVFDKLDRTTVQIMTFVSTGVWPG